MADLLFELFSEEIPARMQKDAAEQLRALLEKALGENHLPAKEVKVFSTPRRLAVLVSGLPALQPDRTLEKKGPKTSAPAEIVEKFLAANHVKKDALVEKDGVYFLVQQQKGAKTSEVLPALLKEVAVNIPWPKSMRWGGGEFRWVRPLRSVLAILDGEVLPLEIGGVKASNVTYGHRFLAPQEIKISKPSEYEFLLEKSCVIADREKRKANIHGQISEAAKKANLQLKQDEGLLEEVTGLVEWPVVLVGSFDQKFLELPPEVVTSEMRQHQKYFALQNADGSLSNKFLITANRPTKDNGIAVTHGNERVLRARLHDGAFYWEQDQKTKLEDWAKKLSDVTFHAKLGTTAEKVQRVTKLAVWLAAFAKADAKLTERAAQLCKADLVTGMVGEFPELQGVMGRYYALKQGEKSEVAEAIKEHYQPLGPSDKVPSNPVSIAVALADKLDTLVGMFAVGEKPTGSKDPFALRRAALGIIRIVLENELSFSMKMACAYALAEHLREGSNDVERLKERSEIAELMDFFEDRYRVVLKERGIRDDYIKAVFEGGNEKAYMGIREADLLQMEKRVIALQEFMVTPEGGALKGAHKRASNIVQKEKAWGTEGIQESLLQQAEEKNLFQILRKLDSPITEACKQDEFKKAMELFASLRDPVDAFFTEVLVNVESQDLKRNRLALLNNIIDFMDGIADFSKVEG